MSWNQVIMTKVGEELLSKMLNGSKLIFTRVVIGDKTVKESQLSIQTAVFSPIPAPALIAGKREVPSGNGTEIQIQVRNDGITETSRMKQVGLFAKTEHDDEVMIGILQDEIGEEIPAYNDFPQFLIELAITIGISRTNNIAVIVSPSVYATKAELEALKTDIGSLDAFLVAEYERDPNKPTYGMDESGGGIGDFGTNDVILKAKTYTGLADVTLVLDNDRYDAENVKRSIQGAFNGDMIIEEDN